MVVTCRLLVYNDIYNTNGWSVNMSEKRNNNSDGNKKNSLKRSAVKGHKINNGSMDFSRKPPHKPPKNNTK